MNVAVLGLGLIGGSVLQALAAGGHRVVGFDADPATRATARTAAARARSGSRWEVAGTIRDAVRDTDLCVLAVPFPALPSVLDEMTGYRGLVTDVTSIKAPVRDLTGDLRFVGGHPMAGKETSGFRAADRGLFVGCAWVLCLEPETETAEWFDLAEIITGLGARVVPATAAEHDRVVAGVSHVPHLLAAALTGAIEGDPLAAALAAGSFRDGTRVAATRPELIAAMCGGNAAAVTEALDQVLRSLQAMRTELSAEDPVAALGPLLAPASAARAAWPPVPGEQAELPVRKDVLLRLGRVGGWVTGIDRERRKVIAMRPETDRNSP
ncbi:prephenate dehydrogenase/arogenate dehydrogenase family protein [Actinoplanes sp. NPDC051470]|uniref:prephenate dehydrogenase/arogenate dehydrogenase family protein n=1 Tax=Actinoplanes sp. NPDC051470 TaxID=3157224 RepID=UPI0034419208